jgi:hypothetical protein
MELKPNFENLSRPVTLLLLIVVMLYAYVENTATVSRAYWLSEAPLIAILLIIAVYWHLRKRIWFWTVIAAVAITQGILAVLFPVSLTVPSSPILFALVVLDLFFITACIQFVGHWMVDRK